MTSSCRHLLVDSAAGGGSSWQSHGVYVLVLRLGVQGILQGERLVWAGCTA